MLAPDGLMFLRTCPDPELKTLLYRHALTMTVRLQRQAQTQKDLAGDLLANYLVLEEWSDTAGKKKSCHEKAVALYGRMSSKRVGKKDPVPTLKR